MWRDANWNQRGRRASDPKPLIKNGRFVLQRGRDTFSDRQTGWQTDKQTHIQTDRQTDRQEVTEEGPVVRNVLSRTPEAPCCYGGRDKFYILSRIAGPGELFSSHFRACARSPRWKKRCSFCLLFKSVAAAMQQLDHQSASELSPRRALR